MAVHSTMLPLGTKLPSFTLPECEGGVFRTDDHVNKAVLVMFICNHCPYVHHLRSGISTVSRELLAHGVSVVAINSNDWTAFPEDAPEKMVEEKRLYDYRFAYVFDESQSVAKRFDAACTPEFYLFNARHELVYRGRFDESTPKNGKPVTGNDLRAAIDALLHHKPMPEDQYPSIGCSIKWRQ